MRINKLSGPCPPGTLDVEAWFLFASLAIGIGAFGWLSLGLPWPHCWLRHTLGIPCPTCGSTRCALALVRGNIGAALLFNPMTFAVFCATGLFDLYAAGTLWFGLPRIRLTDVPTKVKQVISFLVILLATSNWVYLLTNR
jgi:hypothetical protein